MGAGIARLRLVLAIFHEVYFTVMGAKQLYTISYLLHIAIEMKQVAMMTANEMHKTHRTTDTEITMTLKLLSVGTIPGVVSLKVAVG